LYGAVACVTASFHSEGYARQELQGSCCLSDGHLTVGVKGAVAAGRRDHDRIVIGRAEDLGRRIDRADIDEPPRSSA
jgi:hypothetical protein